MSSMKKTMLEKITLNIGVGEAGDKLDKAVRLLGNIAGGKAVKTKTMKRIPTWGVRPNLTIGAKITLRGKKADDLLKRLLQANDGVLGKDKFDDTGNVSFGIEEYILIPGVEYDVDIGVIGLDVAVTLCRKGYRVKRRRILKRRIPFRHSVTKEDAMMFMKDNYGIKMEEE